VPHSRSLFLPRRWGASCQRASLDDTANHTTGRNQGRHPLIIPH